MIREARDECYSRGNFNLILGSKFAREGDQMLD